MFGGVGVGDTHFTGSHIGGIHISLGICVRGYTYHGDTHITVTPGDGGNRAYPKLKPKTRGCPKRCDTGTPVQQQQQHLIHISITGFVKLIE